MAAVYHNSYYKGDSNGVYKKLTDREKSVVDNLPNILESYHYISRQKIVDKIRENNDKVFIDSGAFSAFTLGIKINICEYVDYLIRNKDIIRVEDGIFMASVLDGIGDPLETYRNQLAMEQLGFKPLPCFHYGEDERYLEYYIQNYEYITLGGMVGKSSVMLEKWLNRLWDRFLIDGAGRPKIKVHAFGITSIKIMEQYPWYSCDSSSWVQSAAFGTITDPHYGNLSISNKSPSRFKQGQHVSNLSTIEQDVIFKKLEDNGFNFERLSSFYESRAAYNLWAYGVINTMINAAHDGTYKAKIMELF